MEIQSRKTDFSPWRVLLAFTLLFLLYQSAEGVGARLLGSFAVQATLMVLMVVAAWPVGRWLLKSHGFSAYGLEWRPTVPIWIIAGLVLSGIAKLVAITIGLRIGAYHYSDNPLISLSPSNIGLIFVSTFVASIAEDILTRGLWWRCPPFSKSALWFVFGTAAIYMLNHIFRLSKGPSEWFMLFSLGIAYATAMARTGSLWAAVGLHWGWNLANGLADGVVSLDANPALTPYLSGSTNIVIALIILAVPRFWSTRSKRANSGG